MQTISPEQHKRATEVLNLLAKVAPVELVSYFYSKTYQDSKLKFLDASFVVQHPNAPTHVVEGGPPEAHKPDLSTHEGRLANLLTSFSGEEHDVEIIHFDPQEAAKSILLRGGADIEFLCTLKRPRIKKPCKLMMGLLLPEPTDGGQETGKTIARLFAWHMLTYKKLVPETEQDENVFGFFLPIYLWQGSGLYDLEERAETFTSKQVGGFLGELLNEPNKREDNKRRKYNLERVARALEKQKERLAARERRLELCGDAMISEQEIIDSTPKIDIDREHLMMQTFYKTFRIWDNAAEDLLEELPLPLYGLSFFALRPPEISDEEQLRRCAWKLRGKRKHEKFKLAVLTLKAIATLWLPLEAIEKTLTTMQIQ